MKVYVVVETYTQDYYGDEKKIIGVYTNELLAFERCVKERNLLTLEKSRQRYSYDYETHDLIGEEDVEL